MDLHKLKSEEIRGFDSARSVELERQVRRALHDARMDIYNPAARAGGRIKGLKRTLARLLTLRTPSANLASKRK
jgi:ribosomal protein L29